MKKILKWKQKEGFESKNMSFRGKVRRILKKEEEDPT